MSDSDLGLINELQVLNFSSIQNNLKLPKYVCKYLKKSVRFIICMKKPQGSCFTFTNINGMFYSSNGQNTPIHTSPGLFCFVICQHNVLNPQMSVVSFKTQRCLSFIKLYTCTTLLQQIRFCIELIVKTYIGKVSCHFNYARH